MASGIQPEVESGVAIQALQPRQRADQLVQRMEMARAKHLPRWTDCSAFIAPFSTAPIAGSTQYADPFSLILDESILFCRNTLASGLYWGMTNPSRPWQQWTVTDPDLAERADVKDWLHTANDRHLTVLGRSNFYDTMAWVYNEWPTFATAAVLIEEDDERIVRFTPFGIGSYALMDDCYGEPIGFSRKVSMTLRQVVERFCTDPVTKKVSLEGLSRQSRDKVKTGHLEDVTEVTHLVCPNDEYDPVGDIPSTFPFASYYWERGAEAGDGKGGFLAKEGYREWPLMVFRWARIAGDPWGTDSPGVQTLATVKTLQQMESDVLQMVEKQAKPSLVVPTDLGFTSLLPGAKNVVDVRKGNQIGALHEVKPEAILQAGQKQAEVRQRLQSLWFTSIMLAFSSPYDQERDKTAREVEEVSQEKYLVLGRTVEAAGASFRTESDRVFNIMSRRGLLPPAPASLAGQALSVEFTSILSVALKSAGLSNLREFGFTMAELQKATEDPAFSMKTDWAQFVDEMGIRYAIPPRVIRSDKAVAAMQAEAAKAQQAAQRAEEVKAESEAARNLAASPMTGDTALTRVAGQLNDANAEGVG